jgi:type IV fimbrial biogenesis protein FimT
MVRRSTRGFTLVELLMVTVVFVILLSVGIPSFTNFIRNQRVKTASFDLFSTLVYARSEAITRNASVTVAPIGGAWASGWRVTDSGGTLLREEQALSNMTMTGPATVVYRGSGRLDGAVLPAFQLTSTGDGITTRCIRIDLSGRPYSKAEPC